MSLPCQSSVEWSGAQKMKEILSAFFVPHERRRLQSRVAQYCSIIIGKASDINFECYQQNCTVQFLGAVGTKVICGLAYSVVHVHVHVVEMLET